MGSRVTPFSSGTGSAGISRYPGETGEGLAESFLDRDSGRDDVDTRRGRQDKGAGRTSLGDSGCADDGGLTGKVSDKGSQEGGRRTGHI